MTCQKKVPSEFIKNAADQRAVELGCWVDVEAAEKVRKFATTHCKLSDGDRAGQPADFLDWVYEDVVLPLFAWKRYNERGEIVRRFKRGSIWTPKKQAKTTTLAILSLYMLLEEEGARVYLISSAVETARQLFDSAADMVRTSPTLSKLLWVRDDKLLIQYPQKGSKKKVPIRTLKTLSGGKRGKSGQNANCVLIDECGEIADATGVTHLQNAGMARKQPICPLAISTPFAIRHPYGWSEYQRAKAIQESTSLEIDYLGVVKGVPQDVDWRDQNNWWEHIPAAGVTVPRQYWIDEYESAKDNPRAMAIFRCQLLGQWVEAETAWLTLDAWEAIESDFKESDFYGSEVVVALDGAARSLAAYVLVTKREDKYVVIPRFFHPRGTAIKSDRDNNTNYLALAQAGLITLTTGENDEYFHWPTMKDSIVKDSQRFRFKEIRIDPWSLECQMPTFSGELNDVGIRCPTVPIPPTANYVAEPTRFLEKLVFEGKLKPQKHPLFKQNALNAAVKEDAHSRITLDRDKSGGRYDAIAALVIALTGFKQDDKPKWDANTPSVFVG